jgi:tripartite ATP-independent transporter DctP family solute receptor
MVSDRLGIPQTTQETHLMKTTFTRWLVVAGLALAAALPAHAERKIRIATISANGSPWHKAMTRFAEVAEKESGGQIKVQVFTDGQLGDIAQMYASMQLGTLEMGYFGLGAITTLKGAEPLNVLYVPYLFKSAEAAEKVANGADFAKMYDDAAAKTGVRVVGAFGQRSARAVQTIKGPINKPEDLKGMRIRVPSIQMLKATFEGLGVQVTPMGMLDIYTALSRGTVEGQDNGFDLSMPLKFQEVAKYWSATDHAYELTGWFMSERLWKSLSEAERTALVKAARAGGEVSTAETRRLDADSVETIRKSGGTYTVPDREAFKAALKGVHVPYDGKLWPTGTVERIRAAQN